MVLGHCMGMTPKRRVTWQASSDGEDSYRRIADPSVVWRSGSLLSERERIGFWRDFGNARLCPPYRASIVAESQELRNDLCGLPGAGDEKQMAVVDRDEARTRNEARQDPSVCDRHDGIV